MTELAFAVRQDSNHRPMARETGKPTPGKAGPDDRRERLAAALRDNLRKRKAQSIGAEAQITKPEIHRLIDTVIDLLSKSPRNLARRQRDSVSV